MNIAITGATGFIGGELVKELSQNNNQIRCLVRKSSNVVKLKELDLQLCYGDLDDKESFKELLNNTEIVFHLAAYVSDWGKREDFIKLNYYATHDLLDESIRSGVKKFIYMSTSSVIWKSELFDVHKLFDIDEDYPYPDTFNDYYNESKAKAEKLVLKYNDKNGLNTTVIRASGVWGAGDTVILPRIIKTALKGFLIPAGDGHGIVSPCHIYNLVNALILSSQNSNAFGKIYFINDGIKINHIEFIKMLLNCCGIQWSPKFYVPYKIGYSIAWLIEFIYKLLKIYKPPVISRFMISAIAGSRTYSIKRAEEELGYNPEIDLDTGMNELSKWISSIGGYKTLIKS